MFCSVWQPYNINSIDRQENCQIVPHDISISSSSVLLFTYNEFFMIATRQVAPLTEWYY